MVESLLNDWFGLWRKLMPPQYGNDEERAELYKYLIVYSHCFLTIQKSNCFEFGHVAKHKQKKITKPNFIFNSC